MRRINTLAILVLISLSSLGQESNNSKTSFSFSYVTPYVVLSDWELGVLPVLLNTEANIHYKPFEKISFSTGIGFLRHAEKYNGYPLSMGEEHSLKKVSHFIRVPIQTNFHFNRNPGKADSFAKLVFNNILFLDRVAYFENDITISKEKSISYIPAIGLGVGTHFRRDKPVGILLEGLVEQHLRFDDYSDGIWCSVKIGIII